MKKKPLAHTIGLLTTAMLVPLSPAQAQEDSEQEIVSVIVTGSRIRSDVFSSSSPIDLLTSDQAAVQGLSDVASLLQSTTVAAGSAQVTSAMSSAFVSDGGVGTETISLRGLGANRTLVLLNGRRAGPAGTRGAVSAFDLNVLPLAMIERIEVLKDGASSIYGSDAVAGVVNIITKKDDGGSFDAYTSQPTKGGGEEARLSASWGQVTDFGNFRLAADYYKKSELAKGDRSYFKCGEQYIFDQETGNRADTIDPRTGSPWCNDLLWGHIWLYDYSGGVPSGAKAQYDYDNDLGNYIPGFDPEFMTAPPGWYPVAYDRTSDSVTNADHPFQDEASLQPEVERFTLYGEGEFELNDGITAYAEALFNRRKTYVNDYRQFWAYLYNEDFSFADPASGNPLSEGWRGAQWLSPTPITNIADDSIDVDYARAVAGIRGTMDFFNGTEWDWDLSAQYSKSAGEYSQDIIYDDAISDQNFLTESCVGTTTSVRGVPCIDIPYLDPQFLAGNFSPEIRDFIFGTETGKTDYRQWTLEGFLSGPVLSLPAGDMGMALGFQTRGDEILDVPGEVTLAQNAWGASSAGITKGKDHSKAVFAELNIPVLGGLPLVEDLTINVSGRYTDVNSYGSDSTYKLGLNWSLTDTVRVRASRGTSFRTPALFELFLADQTSFLAQRAVDPCNNWAVELSAGNISQRRADNCAADGVPSDYLAAGPSVTVITGGGYGRLEAETSETNTVGVIWQPNFTNLNVAVDYFDIRVDNEVDRLGASGIVRECYDSLFFPNDPLCDLFQRGTEGIPNLIDSVTDSYLNISRQINRGVDFSATWGSDLFGGNLILETQHTYQIKDSVALFEGNWENDNGQVGEPRWTGRFNTTYTHGDWTYFWGMKFIGSGTNEGHDNFDGNTTTYRGQPIRVVLHTDDIDYHTFSVSKDFPERNFQLRVGVENVFDERPPRVTTLNLGELDTEGNSAFYSQYDWTGRSIFLQFSMALN